MNTKTERLDAASARSAPILRWGARGIIAFAVLLILLTICSCLTAPVHDSTQATINVYLYRSDGTPTTATLVSARADSDATGLWNPANLSAKAEDSPTTKSAEAKKAEEQTLSAWQSFVAAIAGYFMGKVGP